jgi:hypothetical protein
VLYLRTMLASGVAQIFAVARELQSLHQNYRWLLASNA